MNLALERSILAHLGQTDLRFFCRIICGLDHPDNPKSGWWGPAHDDLCANLQRELLDWEAARRITKERRYIAVIVPRGCGKSQIVSQCAMLWLHTRLPNLSTYLGNESIDLAESLLGGIKSHMLNDAPWHLFRRVFSDWRQDAPIWRNDSITHGARQSDSKDPSFGTFSPASGITGRHPDIICMDDLVSYDALSRKSDWFSFAYGSMTDLIPVVEPNGLVLLVGTRYGDGDPFGRSFKSDGILSIDGHQHGPYKTSPDGLWRVFFLDGVLPDGTPAIPTCWPESEIKRYQRRDPVKFASQVRNDPKAHGLHTITEEQFNTLRVSHDKLPHKMSVSIHIDTAFKHESRKLDDSESAIIVAGHPHDGSGRVFILEVHHNNRWRAEQFGHVLVGCVKRAKAANRPVLGLTDERLPTGKDGVFTTWLSNYFVDNDETPPNIITLNRGNGESKDVRISEAIAYVVRGHVLFLNDIPGLDDLRDQLTGHPYAARKDIADAFADIFHPYFYQQRLPNMLSEPYATGGWENALKGFGFAYDILVDADTDRTPLGASGRRPPAR